MHLLCYKCLRYLMSALLIQILIGLEDSLPSRSDGCDSLVRSPGRLVTTSINYFRQRQHQVGAQDLISGCHRLQVRIHCLLVASLEWRSDRGTLTVRTLSQIQFPLAQILFEPRVMQECYRVIRPAQMRYYFSCRG